jgi:D-aminopeptidase
MTTAFKRLDRVLERLPRAYPGPGGAVAVLRKGEVLARHTWGWANAERRIAFTPKTLFRMCSITKQFTCSLVLDAFPDPSVLDGDVNARFPRLEASPPGALHLCHNQSGLRDYWAIAMLHGSPAEAPFGDAEAARLISGTRTLQFTPGTRYSYCNQNFRILGDILEDRTGRSLVELMRTRIFDRVGMETAFLAAETRSMPDGSEGYEGTQASGFRAAVNRIQWTGDAGMGASLDDMIAWEKHIDATRDDAHSLYRRLSLPVTFADGSPASYGFGLARSRDMARDLTGHGGGLRGWRSNRFYAPSERISVVVMFNHLSQAHSAAADVFAAVLGENRSSAPRHEPPGWLGAYVEPQTGLSTRIEWAGSGQIRLRFALTPELIEVRSDGDAGGEGVRLRSSDDELWLDRPQDNQSSRLRALVGDVPRDVAARYHCRELGAEVSIVDAGGAFYGAFSGFLGQGRMELLEPVGPDVWTLPCPRALDFTPPGDWTLAFERDGEGPPARVRVGCWLARNLLYERVG